MKQFLWHGSMKPVDDFRGTEHRKELHLGTFEQASMRGFKHLYLFEVSLGNMKRVKDTGDVGRKQCDPARRAGYDTVVYLNRWEGMTQEDQDAALERFSRKYARHLSEGDRQSLESGGEPAFMRRVSDKFYEAIDRMSDAEFRVYFPNAQDSYALLDFYGARLVEHFDSKERALASHLKLKEPDLDISL